MRIRELQKLGCWWTNQILLVLVDEVVRDWMYMWRSGLLGMVIGLRSLALHSLCLIKCVREFAGKLVAILSSEFIRK